MKTMTVAHSPDADDIFMYYAIKFGWITLQDIAFENLALDIETLNTEALKNTYDITAISFALYPKIRNDYALLRTAVSFGEGYGPKLVKRKETKLKRNFKVALSGTHTTNAMLFKIAYPEARIVYKNFLEIEASVVSGEVDAGVLIHESILEYSDALVVEREMWDIWRELCKEELPLPLGGMALRRSIPLHRAILCEKALIQAVDVAHTHQNVLSRMLLERNLVRVSQSTLKTYLGLYANEHSIEMNEVQYRAIDTLFELGYKHGFYDQSIKVQEYLIPTEYEALRNS
ncbi:MAG: menaquinone biosynthesis family protein [Sulfurospirillum sp.]|nr:menaquinone biosynthesis family protein [Sulfurospirillum sp.]MBP9492149.1 menaquinone biosynthesis family protein [Sulfurospirillum sp.]